MERRCTNCVFGEQLIAMMDGGEVGEDGKVKRWQSIEPISIGQVRGCYNWWQRWTQKPETFIYPGEDDSCVNEGKFGPKSEMKQFSNGEELKNED